MAESGNTVKIFSKRKREEKHEDNQRSKHKKQDFIKFVDNNKKEWIYSIEGNLLYDSSCRKTNLKKIVGGKPCKFTAWTNIN